MSEILVKATVKVYGADSNGGAESNPYRLTPYLTTDRELWLAAEGNGAGDDIMVEDIAGWSRDEIEARYGGIDIGAMRLAADEIAAADGDSADWLRGWCDTYEQAVMA